MNYDFERVEFRKCKRYQMRKENVLRTERKIMMEPVVSILQLSTVTLVKII